MMLPELPPLTYSHYGGVSSYTVEQTREYARACVAAEREILATLCEAFLHNVPPEGGDDLDRIGRYSNGTVMRIAAAIRARVAVRRGQLHSGKGSREHRPVRRRRTQN